MKFSITFEGGAELAKALDELSVRVGRKVMREVLTEAAEPIRKAASSMAPRAPGAPDIADNIGISIPQKSQYLDIKSEMAVVAIGPTRGFAYGVPLELGSVDTAAQPFMRPAFDAASGKALQIVSDATWRELAGRGIQRPMASVDTPLDGEV
jgi:HK97 gp10 family phage protein